MREELLKEGGECLLSGDVDTGKAVLRNYINATIGFQELGGLTKKSPKSLMRMFGPGGNPHWAVLGMFLDPLGLMLLTLPVLLPMFEGLGLDLIWFGVLVVKFLEIGLLTPPVGFNVYVIKSVVGDTVALETIFRGVGWFLLCEAVVVVLLVAFPEISLYLPSTMD